MDQCPSLLTTLAQFWINLLTPQLALLESSCGNAQTNWTAAKIAKKNTYITSSVVASGNVLQVYSHHKMHGWMYHSSGWSTPAAPPAKEICTPGMPGRTIRETLNAFQIISACQTWKLVVELRTECVSQCEHSSVCRGAWFVAWICGSFSTYEISQAPQMTTISTNSTIHKKVQPFQPFQSSLLRNSDPKCS